MLSEGSSDQTCQVTLIWRVGPSFCHSKFVLALWEWPSFQNSHFLYIQWTLDYPDLDYPDPRLSGSRTEIIARAYNDLHMRVVAVDKKIIVYMAAKSVVLSTEDRQVVGQGCLPLSSTHSSPCAHANEGHFLLSHTL